MLLVILKGDENKWRTWDPLPIFVVFVFSVSKNLTSNNHLFFIFKNSSNIEENALQIQILAVALNSMTLPFSHLLFMV